MKVDEPTMTIGDAATKLNLTTHEFIEICIQANIPLCFYVKKSCFKKVLDTDLDDDGIPTLSENTDQPNLSLMVYGSTDLPTIPPYSGLVELMGEAVYNLLREDRFYPLLVRMNSCWCVNAFKDAEVQKEKVAIKKKHLALVRKEINKSEISCSNRKESKDERNEKIHDFAVEVYIQYYESHGSFPVNKEEGIDLIFKSNDFELKSKERMLRLLNQAKIKKEAQARIQKSPENRLKQNIT